MFSLGNVQSLCPLQLFTLEAMLGARLFGRLLTSTLWTASVNQLPSAPLLQQQLQLTYPPANCLEHSCWLCTPFTLCLPAITSKTKDLSITHCYTTYLLEAWLTSTLFSGSASVIPLALRPFFIPSPLFSNYSTFFNKMYLTENVATSQVIGSGLNQIITE